MSFFASAKAALRREVHTTFGVEAFYQDSSLIAPFPITVRYHFKKLDLYGELVATGYAKVEESIEKIVLIPSDTPAITFVRDGRITIPSVGDQQYILSMRDPPTNSLEQVWQVVQA